MFLQQTKPIAIRTVWASDSFPKSKERAVLSHFLCKNLSPLSSSEDIPATEQKRVKISFNGTFIVTPDFCFACHIFCFILRGQQMFHKGPRIVLNNGEGGVWRLWEGVENVNLIILRLKKK